MAVPSPDKIICDLALSLMLGGEAISDIATLRGEHGANEPAASDPTVSRLIAALARTPTGRWTRSARPAPVAPGPGDWPVASVSLSNSAPWGTPPDTHQRSVERGVALPIESQPIR